MDLRLRVGIPVAAAAAAVVLLSTLVRIPGSLSQAIAIISIEFLAVAIVAWLAVDVYLQRPLRRLLQQEQEIPANRDPSLVDSDANLLRRLERLLAQARLAKVNDQEALAAEREKLHMMEEALQESEERYALAVRGANDGLWEWDLKTDRMYLSPRWKAMLGFAEDEFPGTVEAWKGQVYPEDAARFEAALREHLLGATSRVESEHRVLHKDGSHRWIMSRAMAIRHANGSPYRMLGLDTDTTAFKRIEEVLFHVARGTANATGEQFFREMVRHFALALNVRVVWVAQCVDTPVTRMRAVACWDTEKYIDKEYLLEPTPCKKVIEEGVPNFIPQELNVLYPKGHPPGMVSYLGIPIFDSKQRILGHIVFKDDKKMENSILMYSVFQIFTTRAGVELERLENQRTMMDVARADEIPAEERLSKVVDLLSRF